MRQILLLRFIACFFAFTWLGLSDVQSATPAATETYPNRPVTLVLPFGIDSDVATLSRNLIKWLSPHLDNQPLNMDPRPGESGSRAALFVHQAPPDGYTLLIGRSSTQVIAPLMNPQIGYRSNDFTFLGMIQMSPVICVTRGDSPYKTARELLAAIRKQPQKFKYGTSGPSTTLNIAAQYMLYLAGLKPDDAVGVVFKDGPTTNQALIDGKVDFLSNVSTSLTAHLKSGALRGLFTTSTARMAQLPELQNAREIGLRDMENITAWTAILGPPNLPEKVVKRWQKALNQLATDPGWLAGIANLGEISLIKTQKNSDKFIQQQVKFYESLIFILKLQQK